MSIFGLRANYAFLFPNPLWLFTFMYTILIETKKRKMTWSVYLALILIFDCCPQTHDIIHNTDIFPEFLLKEQSHDQRNKTNQLMHEFGLDEIRDHLDEQALHAIETIIMIEFARCNNMSGNSVIKAFDGKQFHGGLPPFFFSHFRWARFRGKRWN